MSLEQRHALRIVLSFSLSFVVADSTGLGLSFIAPLVAVQLALLPAMPVAFVLVLPVVVWVMSTAAGVALQLLVSLPLALGVFMLVMFYAGFRLAPHPKLGVIGLLVLVLFAIIPNVMVQKPDLVHDAARWLAGNVLIAAATVAFLAWLLPGGVPPAERRRVMPVPPFAAACWLLLATVLVAVFQPPATGAALVGVIIALRADHEPPDEIIRARLLAAITGGAAAFVAWEAIWIAPALPVLAAVTTLLAWPFAIGIVRNGPDRGMLTKGLNAFAVLIGEGFSALFDDTDELLWARIVGVMVGLAYAAVALRLSTREAAPRDRTGAGGGQAKVARA